MAARLRRGLICCMLCMRSLPRFPWGARNVYGHPRHEVLDRLHESNVKTYRTNVHGAVSFFWTARMSALVWRAFADIELGGLVTLGGRGRTAVFVDHPARVR